MTDSFSPHDSPNSPQLTDNAQVEMEKRLESLAQTLPPSQSALLNSIISAAKIQRNTKTSNHPDPEDDVKDDPYNFYAKQDSDSPISWSDDKAGWIFTSYADICSLEGDPRLSYQARFKLWVDSLPVASRSSLPVYIKYMSLHLGHNDPPRHDRLRTLFDQVMKAHNPTAIRSRVHDIATDLLGPLRRHGSIDLVGDFAYWLPRLTIAEVLGVKSEDRQELWNAADHVMGKNEAETDKTRETGMSTLVQYFDSNLNLRLHNPTGDMLSTLSTYLGNGEYLIEEIISICNQIFLSASGVQHAISLGMLALLRNPTQMEDLLAGEIPISVAVEELLRFDGVSQQLTRVAKCPIDIRGQTIEPGQRLLFLEGIANRDPDFFDNPSDLDLKRRQNRHLAFGLGPHSCPGAGLARVLVQTGIQTLLDELPNLSLTTETTQAWDHIFDDERERAPHTLPVTFDIPN